MVFFPHEWITRTDEVREHVRVQHPERPPPAEAGDAATEAVTPTAPPIPSEPRPGAGDESRGSTRFPTRAGG